MGNTNVVPFAPYPKGPTFSPDFVLFDGKTRRQWAVRERWPDGTEYHYPVHRGRREAALWMAAMQPRAEARRQADLRAMDRDPIGRTVLAMSPNERADMIKLIKHVQYLTESTNHREGE